MSLVGMSEPLTPQGPSPAADQMPADETEAAEQAAFLRWVEQTAEALAEYLCPPQEVEGMLVWVKTQATKRDGSGSVP